MTIPRRSLDGSGPVPSTEARSAGGTAALVIAALLAASLAGCSGDDADRRSAFALDPGRLKGVEIVVRCARLQVPEDREAAPDATGRTIAIRVAVIPALARKPEPDAIFVFAGGPGQAATEVAGSLLPVFSKLNRDRDLVFVDQRGTGGSNRLSCKEENPDGGLADAFDPNEVEGRVVRCAARLAKGADLTQYTTPTAMRDVDDVRARLGYPRVDLWGASYGTRAALEYLRQFPDRVRTMTLDGVAPASMKLPLAFGADARTAIADLVHACERDVPCATRHASLGAEIDALFARTGEKPTEVLVVHPLTGRKERLRLTRPGLASLLRTPLYLSLTASVLPEAIGNATHDDFDALAALSFAVGGGLEEQLALGMHLSVVCSEDVASTTVADIEAAGVAALRPDGRPDPFALIYDEQYRRLCAHWPTRVPPAAYFASLAGRPGSDVPTLLLSGGIDPATTATHAEEVARGLTHARHLVAPNVGHGVSAQGCAPELIERFVRRADATTLDAACLTTIPRPPFVVPVASAAFAKEATGLP